MSGNWYQILCSQVYFTIEGEWDISLLVGVDEVFLGSLGVWLDGLGARLPVGRADLSVLVCELEGLHQSQGLFDGPVGQRVRALILFL